MILFLVTYLIIFLFAQQLIPFHALLIRIGIDGKVSEAATGSCSVPVAYAGRTISYITGMHDLHRLTFNLMITDAVSSDQDLSTRMLMPGIVDTGLKDDIVDARCTGGIVS